MSYRLNDPTLYRSEDESDRPRSWRAYEENVDLNAMGSGFRTGQNPHAENVDTTQQKADEEVTELLLRADDEEYAKKQSLAEQMGWDFGFGPHTKPEVHGNLHPNVSTVEEQAGDASTALDYGSGNLSRGSGSFGFDPDI